jgi:hypothetical protein
MNDIQTLEFHMLNFFKVKGDYASTMEMNHDLKKNGLPEAGGHFVELLYNHKLVDQKILPNKWAEYKINEYGLARWERLNEEMEKGNRKSEPQIIQHFYITGPNSPVAGRDLKMRDAINNPESPESINLTRRNNRVNKWVLIVAVIAIVVTIAIYLLQSTTTK